MIICYFLNGDVYYTIMIFNCEVCGNEKYIPGPLPRRFCSKSCESAYKRKDRPSDEWLYQKYINEELTAVDIAKIVNKDPKTVWTWLQDARIPTRPRGHGAFLSPDKRGSFKGHKHTEKNKQAMRERRLKDGHVPYLNKDGVHWLKGKRGEASPVWKGGITPERAKFYGTPEWKQIANLVWRRDYGKCQRCGVTKYEAKAIRVGMDIHHIVSFAVKELRMEITNLILLCETCHYWVHSKNNINKEFIKEYEANN